MWTISKDKTWSSLEKEFDWVKRMEEVPQDKIYHAEGNVAVHTQMVLAALENQAGFQQLGPQEKEILWASALLHDVEKYSTTVFEEDGSISSKGHAKKGAIKARQLLYRDLPTPFHIREQIVALVRHHGLPIWLFEKPDPLKALVMASMDLNTEWLALLARADMLGRVCADQEAMLYRIDCFEEFCREQGCWGQARPFVSEDARMYYLQKEDAYPDYVPFDTPLMEVVLMSGLPGAGKDTFIKKNFPEMEVISLDDIRKEWGIKPTDKSGNGRVIQEAKERARVLLRKRKGFVWNATNTTSQMRMQLIELFSTYKAKVHVVYIESPYEELFRQNRGREAIVPDQVLEKLVHKLEVPALWEAHRVSYYV